MLTGAARHQHRQVLGAGHDTGHRGVEVAVQFYQLLAVLRGQVSDGVAGVLEYELPDCRFGVAVGGDGGCVLWAEGECRVAVAQQVVAARLSHGAGDSLQ